MIIEDWKNLQKSHMRINKEIRMQKEQNQIRNIEELVEYGNHPVVISILQTDGSRRSMAEKWIRTSRDCET